MEESLRRFIEKGHILCGNHVIWDRRRFKLVFSTLLTKTKLWPTLPFNIEDNEFACFVAVLEIEVGNGQVLGVSVLDLKNFTLPTDQSKE